MITVITAVYPPGDTACSQSPELIAVIDWPAAGQTGAGNGYGYVFNNTLPASIPVPELNQPIPAQGNVSPLVIFTSGTSVEIGTSTDLTLTASLEAPVPGTFPATFPQTFPDLGSVVEAQVPAIAFGPPLFVFSQDAAPQLQMSFAPPPSGLALGQSANLHSPYGVADQQTLSVTSAGGQTAIEATAASPQYAVSRAQTSPVQVVASPFPFPPGSTNFQLSVAGGVGSFSTPKNFGAGAVVNEATFLSDGRLVSSHQSYTDTANKVRADIVSTDGVNFTLTVTDLISGTEITNPNPVVATGFPYTTGCQFAYAVNPLPDGSFPYQDSTALGFDVLLSCPNSPYTASTARGGGCKAIHRRIRSSQ
ncbi:MAG: hypothetical protein ACLPSH_10585 [Vulcanimicrobiaceae bacterium]